MTVGYDKFVGIIKFIGGNYNEINLLTSGKFNAYFAEVDRQAQVRFSRIVEQMKQGQGITEQLKDNNPLEWTERMNCIKQQAEEIIFSELIYN